MSGSSGNFRESQIPGFVFLTYGDITSPAYNRARLLGMELAARNFQIFYVIDRSHDNVSAISSWQGDFLGFKFVTWRPHFLGVLQRRAELRELTMKGLLIVQLNPNLKAYLSLIGLRGRLVCEWDEPPIFRSVSRAEQYLNNFLHRWFLRKSEFRISCTKYFQKLNPEFAYVPHGYYLPPSSRKRSVRNYAAYLGNLQQPWDHDLIFSGALLLARRGIEPEIHIIGTGPELEMWRTFCSKNLLSNIHFLGHLDNDEMQCELEDARVLLLPMRDTLLNQTRCSSKLLAYAQSGRPVIGHLVGEAEHLLGASLIGIEAGESIMERLATYLSQQFQDLRSDVIDHSYKERADRFLSGLSQIGSSRMHSSDE